MPLDHIQHLLILSEDIEETASWFEDKLGLARGPVPDFKIPVIWVYVGDVPAIHIAQIPKDEETRNFQQNYLGGRNTDATFGSGVIDHIAFGATDLADMVDRLDSEGANYIKRQANAGDLFQLFIEGPNGIRVELNFDAAEAEKSGIKPDLDAGQAVSGG